MAENDIPVGTQVLYVMSGASGEGNRVRPAVVVENWGNKLPPDGNGCVNLQVFIDGWNDRAADYSMTEGAAVYGTLWKTSVQYDPAGAPGTWHKA